jgi:hypothetical protein
MKNWDWEEIILSAALIWSWPVVVAILLIFR